jgi:hypothetical protein
MAPTPYTNGFSIPSTEGPWGTHSVGDPPAQRNLARFTFSSSTVIARLATPTPLAPHDFSIAPYGLGLHHPKSPQARDFEGDTLPEGTGRVVEVAPGPFVRIGLVFTQPHHLA